MFTAYFAVLCRARVSKNTRNGKPAASVAGFASDSPALYYVIFFIYGVKNSKTSGYVANTRVFFTFQETRGAVMNENDSLAGGDVIPVKRFILLPFYDEKM